MQVDGSQLGSELDSREVVVTFRDSAAYAAAIGAERALHLDDRIAGGAWAPPCLVTALEWPLVSGPETLAALGIARETLFGSLLHAFQDSRFHRPIRVGDRLRLTLVLASVRQTGSGALAVLRIRTSAAASGEPVAESWFGAFFRGATATRTGVALQTPAADVPHLLPAESLGVITVSRGRSHVYGECARLWNPIHTEPSFATGHGFADIALHGTMMWAMAGELFIDHCLGGDPRRLRRLYARFNAPMHLGCRFRVQRALSRSMPGCGAITVSAEDNAALIEGVVEFAA